jgi:hypothetical protein
MHFTNKLVQGSGKAMYKHLNHSIPIARDTFEADQRHYLFHKSDECQRGEIKKLGMALRLDILLGRSKTRGMIIFDTKLLMNLCFTCLESVSGQQWL